MSPQHVMYVVGFCACLSVMAGAVRAEQLGIGDGSDWQFVASKWRDSGAGGIAGSRTSDGRGLQSYCLAFRKSKAYSDLDARFTVRMSSFHADLGLIVRAQDPTHFYLVHFPQGAQAFRAQHFWAALSKADGSGYLRFVKLALVRRVASNPVGLAHEARVKVTGNRFQVWVNGLVAFDVRDDTYKAGRIGLSGFGRFDHGKVTVAGTEVEAGPWDEGLPQVKNWFVPFPDAGSPQTDVRLVRTPTGDLLCLFKGGGKVWLGRSKDNGRTWAVDPAPEHLYEMGARDSDIALLKDGRLATIWVSGGLGAWIESADDGRTWTAPTPIETAPWRPEHIDKMATLWQVELKDGTLLRFGAATGPNSSKPIFRWGAVHCQGYAVRSTDGGRTWSAPANLDTDCKEMGNMDVLFGAAFETRDGRIMCLIRPVYSPWVWETWSYDKGKSWGPCVRGPFPGYVTSSVGQTTSGAALIGTRFPGLTIHTTHDDGLTWDEGTLIDNAVWAHGDFFEIEPEVVLFMYEDARRSVFRAQFIRVTPQGLQPVRELLPQ